MNRTIISRDALTAWATPDQRKAVDRALEVLRTIADDMHCPMLVCDLASDAYDQLSAAVTTPVVDSKACSKCGTTKPVAAFYRDAKKRDGRSAWCKDCAKDAARANYQRRAAR